MGGGERGGGRAQKLRHCDRWRKSFDKEQRGVEVGKCNRGGKKRTASKPFIEELQLDGSTNSN